MRILISNDDGYFAPGLAALAEAMRVFGEVTVVAPEQNRSGASNSLTLDRPLWVKHAANGFLYVNGTPSDCVHIALTGLLDHRPDLIVSGINDGQNMGDDTLYSGTVAAAMEGFMFGIPSIAFSLTEKHDLHFDTAARVAAEVVGRYTRPERARLPAAFLLNVNIPNVPYAELTGMACTRLGKRHPSEPVIRAANPRGEPIYWIGPAGAARDGGPGTDFHAITERRVSITPLQIDLTHTGMQGAVADWLAA